MTSRTSNFVVDLGRTIAVGRREYRIVTEAFRRVGFRPCSARGRHFVFDRIVKHDEIEFVSESDSLFTDSQYGEIFTGTLMLVSSPHAACDQEIRVSWRPPVCASTSENEDEDYGDEEAYFAEEVVDEQELLEWTISEHSRCSFNWFNIHFDPRGWDLDERKRDLLSRWDVAIRNIAQQSDAKSISAIDYISDDPFNHRIFAPFDSEGSAICVWLPDVEGVRETENSVWIRAKGPDFPVEANGQGWQLWTGGKRGHGKPVALNWSLYSGRIIDPSISFDWSRSQARLAFREQVWNAMTLSDLVARIGKPNFLLDPIDHSDMDYSRYEAIGITDQWVYTQAVPDSVMIVRRWSDGLFTVLGIDFPQVDATVPTCRMIAPMNPKKWQPLRWAPTLGALMSRTIATIRKIAMRLCRGKYPRSEHQEDWPKPVSKT